MSAIDDTRKVLQDFLEPELRELKARVDALEKRMTDGFDHIERNAEIRHTAVIAEIKGLSNYSELRERVAKLESVREAVHP